MRRSAAATAPGDAKPTEVPPPVRSTTPPAIASPTPTGGTAAPGRRPPRRQIIARPTPIIAMATTAVQRSPIPRSRATPAKRSSTGASRDRSDVHAQMAR